MHLLSAIEAYLRRSGIPASRFGRDVLGDPGFVHGLRRGREPRATTVRKVAAYLTAARNQAESER